ncbi:MAG: hypothetical protein IKQ92_06760 [Clostridia bacterium]|nr:hypothetical protein [Clostridia bacterium]
MTERAKRILALVLALILTASVLVSCGESAENADPAAPSGGNAPASPADPGSAAGAEEPETEEDLLVDGLPDTDFQGYAFRAAYGSDDVNYSIAEDYTGTPVVDAVRESTLYIEDRFNITVKPILYENSRTPYTSSILAGDDAFDIQFAADWAAYPMAKEGLFIDMFTVEQFDFSKPWWPQIMLDNLSVCGSMYCSSNYISYMGLDWTRALFINKDYAAQLNLPLPYDTVREGAWTLDAMISYVEGASMDLNGTSGIDAGDSFGFVTGSQTWYCLQESVDIPVYRRDADNVPYLDFDSERIDTYVSKMRGLIASDDFRDAGDFFGVSLFLPGRALLCYGQLADAFASYRNADFAYGFLPAPKFDETQKTYISCCTDRPWAIPITVGDEQLDLIGTVCEALSCRNYRTVLPVYFESTMKSRLADAPDDAEMLQIIADTRTTSFSFAYDLEFSNILGDLGKSSEGVGSYFQKSSKLATKKLEQLVKAFQRIKNK